MLPLISQCLIIFCEILGKVPLIVIILVVKLEKTNDFNLLLVGPVSSALGERLRFLNFGDCFLKV